MNAQVVPYPSYPGKELSLQTMKNFEYLAAGLPEIQMSLGIKSLE
jgi:hypothetical protein